MPADPAAPERMDVVAVGPHPDDLEITCGGTLALLARQGYKVGIIDLTSGEPTPRGSEETRAREAEEARRVLGVQARVNLGLPNRVLMDGPEARFALATQLRRWRPPVLIALAGRTPAASPDHHQAHLLSEASRFYSQLTKWDDRFAGTAPYRVPHLVYSLFPFDAEQRSWHSTFVIDITPTFEQKLEAVRCYHSQFDEARFAKVRHFLTGYNIFVGGRCGFAYGEMFALPHPVGATDLFALVSGGKGSPAPVQLPGQDHLPTG
ncbi:MAG TPA: PIG-L family deacetylase [Gemmataceae bacterium]|nr:PIG-L family deacetylase [Gemmataceae bacterium]